MNQDKTQTQAVRKPTGRHNRQWACSECSQAFKKREHLLRHTRSHTKEKPYGCQLCSKAYGRQDSLIRHARTHARMPTGSEMTMTLSPVDSNDQTTSAHWRPDEGQAHSSFDHAPSALRSFMASTAPNSTGPPIQARIYSDPGVTNSLESPETSARSAQSDSLGGGALPGSLDRMAMDLGLFDFGCDKYEPNWLLGEDFDMNTLGSSIATVGPTWGYGDAAVPNVAHDIDNETTDATEFSIADATHVDVLTRVRDTWYSKPTLDLTYGQPLFVRQQYQDRVDETYRAGLANRLRPRLYDGVLPSADFLNLCIKLYFAKFHPIFPIVHSASFRPSSENALLLLSICSLGALFVGSASAAARGRAIFMKLNKTILASWEAYVFRGGREALSVAQAAVLGQTFGILSGNPNDLLLAESFHGTIIAWTRQAGMFQVKSLLQNDILPQSSLLSAWRSWSQAEEAMRVVLALYIHDSEFTAIFHHEPLLRHSPRRLPRCCSDELFSAPSAERWHDLVKARGFHGCTTGHPGGQLSPPEEPPYQALMHSYAILAGRVAAICESRCEQLDDAAVEEYRQSLMSWHAAHVSAVSQGSRDPSCLMVLWHEAFMYLYADFDLVERVLGRDGLLASQDDANAIQTWVASADGKRCVVHAMLIYRRLETLPINTELALHVPKALFYSGLVIYCHVKFRSTATASGDMDVQELRSSDGWRFTSPSILPCDSIVLSQLDSSALYNVADLLRRQGHWEVSRRFALILDALIETLADSAASFE